MLRIDAHHHLWRYNAEEYGWLDGDLSVLRRDFLQQDLLTAMASANVAGAVAVQARQAVVETDWLLDVAAGTPEILGVVGWLPLRDVRFPALLERYAENRLLRGLRHVVQGEPDGFMDDPAFNAGIGRLSGMGLAYDLLIFERQLDEAIRLVDRHPQQSFVLDHIAKPLIAVRELEPWAAKIRELARRPHVTCKLSGMVTEADPSSWTAAVLTPYFETVLEAFTPSRLMVGTDWPVVLARCSYAAWWDIVAGWIERLSPLERAQILGRTAMRTYALQPEERGSVTSDAG